MVRLLSAVTATLFATLAAAQNSGLSITQPTADIWWVAQSTNVMAWTCNTSPYPEFTVLIEIPGVPSPLQFLGIQKNFDCSIIVTNNQVNQAPGTGYRLLIANILNSSDIYAASDPFEIKPLGSAYPSQITPPVDPSAGNPSASQPANDPKTTTSGALSVRHAVGTVGALAAAAIAGFLA
ncbi:hypothetical protein CVT24_010909 [Panaeolus cyanescens]|uniref:Uncharacterized protein n=1 Tax=Panaeolus cyanescens TaxID=181874 RepID=A0A409WAT7_9AGAR|nr:hypothetical protein CVT24_010909 [Panaeolus cyanescens]